jgi:short subunit dehydrogenase-like uncharacterized protein
MARPFDVVVWGATGFTGRLVCEQIFKHYQVILAVVLNAMFVGRMLPRVRIFTLVGFTFWARGCVLVSYVGMNIRQQG